MNDPYVSIVRAASERMEPVATGLEPRLPRLADIRAVVFDIYGTLLISGSGDIGASDPVVRGEAFASTMRAMGWEWSGAAEEGAAELRRTVENGHRSMRAGGIDFPEVDIVEVWRETCERLVERGRLTTLGTPDWARAAVEFETRTNPVWPMPDLERCLARLQQGGQVMGIISNAQFFTPLLFPALLGKSLDQLGIDPGLRYYSYEYRCAKPGQRLYQIAAEELATRGIDAAEVLYVGNDMRNDIGPAAAIGFRTALFAGDKRSLRLRADEVGRGEADAIVTELRQIPELIGF